MYCECLFFLWYFSSVRWVQWGMTDLLSNVTCWCGLGVGSLYPLPLTGGGWKIEGTWGLRPGAPLSLFCFCL